MYSATYSYSFDDSAIGPVLAFLGAYMAIFAVVGIIMIVANWRIFTKAGEAGWKAIIPFYNEFISFKLFWQAKFFWVMIGIGAVGGALNLICNQFDGGSAGALIFAVLSGVATIAGAIIGVIKTHKMSLAFGHGTGFTLGLIFLNPIFLLILAFGSSEYKGAQQ